MPNWIEEIDLRPSGPPVSMGVRKLGTRPWLLIDEYRDAELSLKAELTKDPNKIVFLALNNTEQAGNTVLSLIRQSGISVNGNDASHPLEKAGLSVQEDLCLVRRTAQGWVLEAASLCFPSLWKLSEKIGHNMSAVHGPVDDYPEHLENKVEGFFD